MPADRSHWCTAKVTTSLIFLSYIRILLHCMQLWIELPPLSRHLVVFHFSLNWNIIFVSILLGVHTCKHFNHHEHIHSYFLNLNCSLLQTGCVIQRHGAGQSIHSRVFFNLSFLLRDKVKCVHILMLYIGAYLAWAKYRCTIFVLVPPCFPGLQKIFSLGC